LEQRLPPELGGATHIVALRRTLLAYAAYALSAAARRRIPPDEPLAVAGASDGGAE
jgi:hypothetical protein